MIDQYYNEDKPFFTVSPAPFSSSLLKVDEVQTYTDAVFEMTLSITVPLLPLDYIEVRPPIEMDLPFSNDQRVLVSAEAPMSPSLTRSVIIKDKVGRGFVIRITGFVSKTSRYIDGTSDLKFKLEQLRSPLSTKTSSSFKVYTKDDEGRIMNYIDSDLSATMLKGKTISDIKVTSSSYRVGDLAGHTLTFKTVVPLVSTDSFLIMYPEETFPPVRAPKCDGGDLLDKK